MTILLLEKSLFLKHIKGYLCFRMMLVLLSLNKSLIFCLTSASFYIELGMLCTIELHTLHIRTAVFANFKKDLAGKKALSVACT